MARITAKDFRLCYRLGVQFVNGAMSFDDAVDRAVSTGMNRASASDYIRNVKYILSGFPYKRTISAAATEYYLSRIKEEFGAAKLNLALKALEGHIEYYEGIQTVTLHKQRAILDAFQVEETQPRETQEGQLFQTIDELSADFQRKVAESACRTRTERLSRLRAAPTCAKRTVVKQVAYIRNPDVVAERLFMAGGVCEGCRAAAPFERDDGTLFLEVHHILPLSEDGPDTVENTIALCPNCHREAHFGKNRNKFQ